MTNPMRPTDPMTKNEAASQSAQHQSACSNGKDSACSNGVCPGTIMAVVLLAGWSLWSLVSWLWQVLAG